MLQLFNRSLGGRLAPFSPPRFRHHLALAAIGIMLMLPLHAVPALADGGAVMSVTPAAPRFFCGNTLDVTFGYTPDEVATPVLRGYSIRIIAPYGLDFEEVDISVYSPLGGVNDTYLITMNDVNDYTIDFTFLDPGAGLSVAADLFTISVHDRGFNIPFVQVGIDSGRFRTPENQDIVVDISATAMVDVVCVSPTPPTLDPEPEFTPGTTNTLSWSDEAWAGAFEYNVFMSTDPGFAVIADESGWIPGLSHQFTGLADDQVYYFKVRARNFTQMESVDSAVEQTLQDASPPVTSIDPLDPDQFLVDWDLSFQAADPVSGFDKLEIFYRFDGGVWTSYGEHTSGPVGFTALEGDGLYEFYSVGTDLAGNVEAVPAGPQASTTLDTSQPYGSFAINSGAVATNSADVFLVVSVIRAVEMRFSNNGIDWPEGWIPLGGVHPWTIPATEGVQTVYGEFRDAAMQVMAVTDDIEYDITPPGPVTAPAASPGHEAVVLTWTNPPDADFKTVGIWRGLVHDGSHVSTYPSYIGSVVPTLPADWDEALASPEWELAGQSEPGATTFTDSVATRGIYLYEFFAADPAFNLSPPTGLTTRATNYILGDVADPPHDGSVLADDLTVLGATYGISVFNPLFNGVCDVGPTADSTGTGIPQPDDQINVDDLMIFEANYSPSAKSSAPGDRAPGGSPTVSLAWKPVDERTWSLDLAAPCPSLKGVGLSGNLPPGVDPAVACGEAVLSQTEPYFLAVGPGLEAGLVILGSGRGLAGTGSLLTFTVPDGVDPATVSLESIGIELRDLHNRPLEYDLQGKSGESPPAAFWLAEAFPNPFNPSTTIRFSIAADMPVRLEIYGMDGRRLAVLVDETLEAGQHEAVWLGRDDNGRQVASGVYFSKLRAGSQSRVRKMTLMK